MRCGLRYGADGRQIIHLDAGLGADAPHQARWKAIADLGQWWGTCLSLRIISSGSRQGQTLFLCLLTQQTDPKLQY